MQLLTTECCLIDFKSKSPVFLYMFRNKLAVVKPGKYIVENMCVFKKGK